MYAEPLKENEPVIYDKEGGAVDQASQTQLNMPIEYNN